MNIYSDEDKQHIRTFFENKMPTFPFIAHARPCVTVNAATQRELCSLCKEIDLFLPAAVLYFIRNLSEKNFNEVACSFELEIMETQGFISMLYIYELANNRFQDTLTSYTCEYLRLKNEERLKHDEAWVDYLTVIPVINIPPAPDRFDLDYSSYFNSNWWLPIKQLERADLHKIVVVTKEGEHTILPLARILSCDYGDFDPDPYPKFDNRLDLADVDPEMAMQLINSVGLQGVILPPEVYEVTTKC